MRIIIILTNDNVRTIYITAEPCAYIRTFVRQITGRQQKKSNPTEQVQIKWPTLLNISKEQVAQDNRKKWEVHSGYTSSKEQGIWKLMVSCVVPLMQVKVGNIRKPICIRLRYDMRLANYCKSTWTQTTGYKLLAVTSRVYSLLKVLR